MNEGFKKRLSEAKDNSEELEIWFNYSNSEKPFVRKGKVIEVFDDCFEFEDRFQGQMTFGYAFIVSIEKWKEVK